MAVNGCSGDDNTTPAADSGKPDSTGGQDTGPPPDAPVTDSPVNNDSGDGGSKVPPNIGYVHAAPEIGTVVLCTKVAGQFISPKPSDPIPPLVAFPVPLTDPDALSLVVFPSQDYIIQLAAIPPLADGGLPDCTAITNGSAGVPASAIFATQVAPAGTFGYGKSYLLTILGCAAKDDGGTRKCGSDFDGGTSVREEIVTLDRTTNVAGATAIGAQVLHLSPQLQSDIPSGVTTKIVPEAGAPVAVGATIKYDPHPTAATPVPAAQAPTALANVSATTVSLFDPADGGSLGIDFPLDIVSLFTTGDPDAAAFYKAGQNYTFIVVGDPAVNPAPDNDGIRIIAIPNKP